MNFRQIAAVGLVLVTSVFTVVGCKSGAASKPPTKAPTAKKGAGADTTKGSKDTSGADASVCANVDEFVGVCDPDVPDFAWFCSGGELWLLDCTDVNPDASCVDDGAGTWDCIVVTSP